MKVKNYDELIGKTQPKPIQEEFGCGFCWDKKRKKTKDLFFLDAANNMRPCVYCPSCGRVMEETDE